MAFLSSIMPSVDSNLRSKRCELWRAANVNRVQSHFMALRILSHGLSGTSGSQTENSICVV